MADNSGVAGNAGVAGAEGALEYVVVTPGSQAFDDAEAINQEAFPPNDRKPMQELLDIAKIEPGSKIVAVYEQGECVGFYHMIEQETFVHAVFFAVSAAKRGQGYGTKILKVIIQNCNGKPFIGEVEYPSEDAENYEQRVKRIRFYERNGVHNTGETIEFADNGKYNIIVSQPDAPLQDYLAFVKKGNKITACSF